jgi:E1A/CREB-binding protein
MLDQGMAENIIIQYKDTYKQAIEDKLQSAAELHYFEGDFWPKVMEGIICDKKKEEECFAAEESEKKFTEMTSEGIKQRQKKQKWSAVLRKNNHKKMKHEDENEGITQELFAIMEKKTGIISPSISTRPSLQSPCRPFMTQMA